MPDCAIVGQTQPSTCTYMATQGPRSESQVCHVRPYTILRGGNKDSCDTWLKVEVHQIGVCSVIGKKSLNCIGRLIGNSTYLKLRETPHDISPKTESQCL